MGLNRVYLISLAVLVGISLILIVVGGSISAWCTKIGSNYECHSLFYSNENFSCLFKLIPAGVIICLSLSLIMFIVLLLISNAKKEYQLVARFVNIFVLSLAIIFIMIVLLQWFHPSSHASKNILIARLLEKDEIEFSKITSKDSLYLTALEVQQRSLAIHRVKLNHGPNLFSSAFAILLFTLIFFIILHRAEIS